MNYCWLSPTSVVPLSTRCLTHYCTIKYRKLFSWQQLCFAIEWDFWISNRNHSHCNENHAHPKLSVFVSAHSVWVYVTLLCVRGEGNYPACTHSVVKEGGTAQMLPCNQAVRLRFKLPHCHLKIGEHGGWAIAEVEPQITRCCFFWAWRLSFSKLRACLLFSSDLWIVKMYSRPVNTAEVINLKNSLFIQRGLNVWEMYLVK